MKNLNAYLPRIQYRPYRRSLTRADRTFYDDILKTLLAHKELLKFSDGHAPTDMHALHCAWESVINDVPELLGVGKMGYAHVTKQGKIISAEFSYASSVEEHVAKLQELAHATAPLLRSCAAKKHTFSQVKEVHDWFVVNCRYNADAPRTHTAYGSLVERVACCEGFSHGAKYLFDRLDIPCVLVSGFGDNRASSLTSKPLFGGNHSWVAVCIDGAWFHMDISNDVCLSSRWCHYDYFLLSDNELCKTHTFNVSPALPRCLYSFNMYERMGLVISKKADIAPLIEQWDIQLPLVVKLADAGKKGASASFKEEIIRQARQKVRSAAGMCSYFHAGKKLHAGYSEGSGVFELWLE